MYKIQLSRKASKSYRLLQQKDKARVMRALKLLELNPNAGKQLKGVLTGYSSYRVWPYRIIYTIKKKRMIVLVIKIAHRQGVYAR